MVASFFAADLASDFGLFMYTRKQTWEANASLIWFNPTSQSDLEEMNHCRRVLASWHFLDRNLWGIPDFADSSLVDDLDRENMSIIQRAHEQYRHAFGEQEQMRTDGSFVRAAADAIARMPVARSLVIDDNAQLKPASFAPTMATPALFFTTLVQPDGWGLC